MTSSSSALARSAEAPAVAAVRLAYTPAAMDAGSSNEELMMRFAAGDAAAFDALYARHRGGVFRYLLRQCQNRATAEELFQDVWMNLVHARSRYRVQAKFATYLYTLAHNRLIDHFRRHKRLHVVPLGEDDSDPMELQASPALEPERGAQAREQAARLLRLVADLPDVQREAFLLHEEGELSLDEIAQVTGANRETVKSRLRYAMDKLRDGMKDYL